MLNRQNRGYSQRQTEQHRSGVYLASGPFNLAFRHDDSPPLGFFNNAFAQFWIPNFSFSTFGL
jgi:hypothetical protein